MSIDLRGDRPHAMSSRISLRFQKNSVAVVCLWILIGFIILSLFGFAISPYGLGYQSESLLMPPSWDQAGEIRHFLGTDDLGHDLLSQLIIGARLSFGGSIVVVLIAAFVGIPLGFLAGMSKGIKSSILHHLMDTALSIPSLLIALILVSLLGPGLVNTLIAISIALIPQFVRVVYNAVAQEMQKEYVVAIRLDGASPYRILRYGVLPNISAALIGQTSRALGSALTDITALGFIGIGAQSPLPEWGALLSSNRDLIFLAPWTVVLPGVTIMLCILSFNVVGEGLRRAVVEGLD
ncbi:ABC transporter permease subunit [Alginatibacterium sediminis]|uniref:ABC transporter permease subunit n=1 Tax=Alginatibacterium sediminis TaxID=2164068 RepID=A0A420EGH8_9ALTE|nr:ABC transporter permease subunit [Alginatibacterium sediminis]RKF19815.1 ABC transporter permease subunit [Alginatibacterium sediminis]